MQSTISNLYNNIYHNSYSSTYKFKVTEEMLNPFGIFHGGELVKKFDDSAGETAIHFAGKTTLTRAIKEVNFYKKISLSDTVIIKNMIFNVKKSSIYVYSEAFIENKEKVKAADTFFIFVGVDKNFQPAAVPELKFKSIKDLNKSQELLKKFKNI